MATIFEPGMDDDQAQEDRKGWKIPSGMPTGDNEVRAYSDGGGPEVGNPYDLDPMGEEYHPVTYADSSEAKGQMGSGRGGATPSEQQPRKTADGKKVASAPQNYTSSKSLGGSD